MNNRRAKKERKFMRQAVNTVAAEGIEAFIQKQKEENDTLRFRLSRAKISFWMMTFFAICFLAGMFIISLKHIRG